MLLNGMKRDHAFNLGGDTHTKGKFHYFQSTLFITFKYWNVKVITGFFQIDANHILKVL